MPSSIDNSSNLKQALAEAVYQTIFLNQTITFSFTDSKPRDFKSIHEKVNHFNSKLRSALDSVAPEKSKK